MHISVQRVTKETDKHTTHAAEESNLTIVIEKYDIFQAEIP